MRKVLFALFALICGAQSSFGSHGLQPFTQFTGEGASYYFGDYAPGSNVYFKFYADGGDAINVTAFMFTVTGLIPQTEIYLYRANGDGTVDVGDSVNNGALTMITATSGGINPISSVNAVASVSGEYGVLLANLNSGTFSTPKKYDLTISLNGVTHVPDPADTLRLIGSVFLVFASMVACSPRRVAMVVRR